jgi:hypothetical protein
MYSGYKFSFSNFFQTKNFKKIEIPKYPRTKGKNFGIPRAKAIGKINSKEFRGCESKEIGKIDNNKITVKVPPE